MHGCIVCRRLDKLSLSNSKYAAASNIQISAAIFNRGELITSGNDGYLGLTYASICVDLTGRYRLCCMPARHNFEITKRIITRPKILTIESLSQATSTIFIDVLISVVSCQLH